MDDKEMYGLPLDAPEEEAAPEAVETPAETVATPEVPASPAPTAAATIQEERVPLAALKAEREKRQAYERELAAYRQREQQQQAPPPNFYDAPEQYVHQLVFQERQHMTAVMYNALEAQARETYSDYDDVFAELQAYAQENPACVPQIMNSANPATAAYKFGKQLRELKAMQNPAEYRQKIEAEIRAKVEAEYKAKDDARAAQLAAIPPDISAVRSTRATEVAEDDSLEAILASRNKR